MSEQPCFSGLLSVEALELELSLAEKDDDNAITRYQYIIEHIESSIQKEQKTVSFISTGIGIVLGLCIPVVPIIGAIVGGIVCNKLSGNISATKFVATPYYNVYLRAKKGIIDVQTRINEGMQK